MSGMIRRLRWKSVGISMLFVTLVLAAVFTGVMLTARSSLEQSSTRQLEKALRGEGYDGQNGQPCFVTEVYSSGTVRVMGSSYYQISEEDLLALVQECLSQQEESGLLTDYHLRYLRYDGALSIRIAFTDSTLEQSALRAMAGNLLLIALAALVVLLGCSYLLSGVAARPVERAWQEQQRFLSDASHELRTPLAAIHGYAELYKMQRDMPGALERADESIEHIERSSQRMTVLVEDLLSLARLDEGRGIDMTGTVKLSSLVTDAVDDLHALDPDRAVRRMQISLEPARDLNHPAEFSLAEGDWPEVVLPGDASRLRQVVTNIVGNIHRYTPADSPAEAALGVMPAAIDPRQLARMPASDASMRRFIDAAEVGASMQTGYRYAVLRFVDHGPGVPPESRSKIFERFYTADPSRAREKGGTGLGMAIAQSVVKAHHGFICATGTDGGGLTFTVVLPIEQIAAPEPKQSTGKTKDAKQKTSWFSSERKTQATQPKA